MFAIGIVMTAVSGTSLSRSTGSDCALLEAVRTFFTDFIMSASE